MRFSSRTIGILQIIGSGFAFGLLAVFGKQAFAAGLSPGEFLFFRFVFAAPLIGVILLILSPKSLLMKKEAILHCVALGAFGYAVFSSCFFQALTGLSVSLTVLLLYTYPIFVTLGAHYFFAEKISRTGGFWLAVTMVGLVFLVWGDLKIENTAALFFGLGSAFFYSGYILLARKWLAGVDAFASIFFIQLGTAVVLAIFFYPGWDLSLSKVQSAAAPIAGTVIFSTIIAMGLFLAGLKRLAAAEASVLSTAEPIASIIAAYLVFGEIMTPLQTLGACLVLGALVGIARTKKTEAISSGKIT